jgi:formamidopyrimidine-DNA glycosylase
MPELPEVETVRRGLEQLVVGTKVTGSTIGNFPGVIGDLDHGTFTTLLTGSRIVRVSRRAKYLFIETDGPAIVQVHLRMTGRIIVTATTAPPIRFEYLAIHLDDNRDIRYGDQRKFGRVTLIDSETHAALSQQLGPEPLSRSLTGARLHASFARRTGKIKSALLDQHLVAGLGNIYVDEVLFRTRIHPESVPSALTVDECIRLVRAIRSVLNSAIANQGTTFSTFENPYGEGGSNAARLLVYGKGGRDLPCPRCGTTLERILVGGRGTTFCPNCQILKRLIPAPT